jgi:hypothetical protein
VQRLQRHGDGDRLTSGRAAVGLERVAEPAVRVAIGGDGVANGRRLAAAEEALESPPLENSAVSGEEPFRRVEIRLFDACIEPCQRAGGVVTLLSPAPFGAIT